MSLLVDPDTGEEYEETLFIAEGADGKPVDLYDASSGIYYGLLLVNLLYLVLLFCQWVTVQNVHITHTYFSNPSAPGILYSLRFVSPGAIAIALMSTRIFAFLSLLCLLVFRRERSWSLFWLALLTVCVVLQTAAFWMLVAEYAQANAMGNRYGLASDPWYCCDPVRHGDPRNFCMNSLPCGAPVWPTFSASDLRVDSNFWYLFVVNMFLYLIDLGLLVWLLMLWRNMRSEREEPEQKGPPAEARAQRDGYRILPSAPVEPPPPQEAEPPLGPPPAYEKAPPPEYVPADVDAVEAGIRLNTHGLRQKKPLANKRK